jgi:hypothetical protein
MRAVDFVREYEKATKKKSPLRVTPELMTSVAVVVVVGAFIYFSSSVSLETAVLVPCLLLPLVWRALSPVSKTQRSTPVDKKKAELLGVNEKDITAKAKKATPKKTNNVDGGAKRTHTGVMLRRMQSPPGAAQTPRRPEPVRAYFRASPSSGLSPMTMTSPGHDLLASNSPITTVGELERHQITWNAKPTPPAKVSYALEQHHHQSPHGGFVNNYTVSTRQQSPQITPRRDTSEQTMSIINAQSQLGILGLEDEIDKLTINMKLWIGEKVLAFTRDISPAHPLMAPLPQPKSALAAQAPAPASFAWGASTTASALFSGGGASTYQQQQQEAQKRAELERQKKEHEIKMSEKSFYYAHSNNRSRDYVKARLAVLASNPQDCYLKEMRWDGGGRAPSAVGQAAVHEIGLGGLSQDEQVNSTDAQLVMNVFLTEMDFAMREVGAQQHIAQQHIAQCAPV